MWNWKTPTFWFSSSFIAIGGGMNILADKIPELFGWTFIGVGIVGIVISGGMWLFQFLKKKGLLEKLQSICKKIQPEESICVKRTWVHYNQLEEKHYLSFSIEVFNGSLCQITIENAKGALNLTIDGDKYQVNVDQQIEKTIEPGNTNPYEVDRFSLCPVLPNDIKRKFLDAIRERKNIYIDISEVDIKFSASNKPAVKFRLPIWETFTSYMPDEVRFDIVITVSSKQVV